jgi:hypothetical protein
LPWQERLGVAFGWFFKPSTGSSPWKKEKSTFQGGGEGELFFFASVFFKYLTMPKTKKKDKMKTKAEGSGKSLLVEPSSECKEFVVALIARFYERESTMSLESCYIRYAEEGITKFKTDMTQRVMDALHNDKWMEEKFLDNVVHDSIWNVKNILTKYGKVHSPGTRHSRMSSRQQTYLLHA